MSNKGININNEEKIAARLTEVEGPRVTARTMRAVEVRRIAEVAERKLRFLPAYRRVGARAYACPWAAPLSYFGRPMGTFVTLERRPSGWFLVNAGRAQVLKTSHGYVDFDKMVEVTLPRMGDAEMLERLLKRAGVKRPTDGTGEEVAA